MIQIRNSSNAFQLNDSLKSPGDFNFLLSCAGILTDDCERNNGDYICRGLEINLGINSCKKPTTRGFQIIALKKILMSQTIWCWIVHLRTTSFRHRERCLPLEYSPVNKHHVAQRKELGKVWVIYSSNEWNVFECKSREQMTEYDGNFCNFKDNTNWQEVERWLIFNDREVAKVI